MSGLLVTPRWKEIPSRLSSHVSVPEDTWEPQEPPPEPSTEGDLQLERVIECDEEVMTCRFNPSGTLLAVGLLSGVIKVYSVTDGSCVHCLKDDQTVIEHLPVTSIRFLPNRSDSQGDLFVATYAGGRVKFWHLSTQSCVHALHEDRQTLVTTFSPSGKHFLTAGSSQDILVYDTETMARVSVCQPSASLTVMDGHYSRIFGLAFHPQSEDDFISGGWDNTVQFWNIRHPHSLRKISGPHVCGDALDIDAQTNEILIGSWRKEENLQIWDAYSCQKLQTVPNDYRGASKVYNCRWLGPSHLIVAGSDMNMCRIVDRSVYLTRGCLLDLPGGVYSMDVSTHKNSTSPLIAVTSSQSVFLLHPTGNIVL
ncbi:WD repeat-containing protein wdr-5.2 [Bombina bombina]|uniref:WD repeat-containing protein wdr-5.2 n=1 Tax=Bombina bombina TaxID=8345 RepID=UPI00235A756A|nr:WD repeat-containing protein wdr-5.2 [Bombina bombina]